MTKKQQQKKKARERRVRTELLQKRERKLKFQSKQEIGQQQPKIQPIRNDTLTSQEWETLLENLGALQEAEQAFLDQEKEREKNIATAKEAQNDDDLNGE